MKITSTYRRSFTTVVDNKPVDDSIMIPCSMCKSCGGYYHAVLPDILIPFSSYTLLFVLTVLESYVNRVCTVAEICSYWHISLPTLYNWKHRFMAHHDLWFPALVHLRKQQDSDGKEDFAQDGKKHIIADKNHCLLRNAILRLYSDISFIREFFLRFLFSFLQGNKKTHLKRLSVNCRI